MENVRGRQGMGEPQRNLPNGVKRGGPPAPEYVGRCPACGDPIDYCQGHGEMGDPAGFRILQDHDGKGGVSGTFEWHRECHPMGCDEALAAKFPQFAWPGAYSVVYVQGNDFLCHECARDAYRDEGQATPVGQTHDEGPPIECDGCDRTIPSSYGDPDEEGGSV